MNKSIAEMLKKGYILFPKVLFEEQMKMTKNATGSFEAFILVLTHVNYSTVTCRVNGQTFECRRGESVDHLTDTKYCMQASTYLSDKAFLDEYDY